MVWKALFRPQCYECFVLWDVIKKMTASQFISLISFFLTFDFLMKIIAKIHPFTPLSYWRTGMSRSWKASEGSLMIIKLQRHNIQSNRDGEKTKMPRCSRHPSILHQQWNPTWGNKQAWKCHGRARYWSSWRANLSFFLSAGQRILWYGSTAAD